MTPTVRKYPRTLNEAFPQDYAMSWWEPHRPNYGLFNITLRIAAVVLWVWLAYYFTKD